MLDRDHALSTLQTDAALASGWPTLHVLATSEEAVDDAKAIAEDLLGPLLQADVVEPFDTSDPDEPWELRVDLPGLDADAWATLRDALEDAGHEPLLVPGVSPGARAAEDVGRRLDEELRGGGLVARMVFDPDLGGVITPDVARADVDDDLLAVRDAVDVGLAAHAPGVGLSDATTHDAAFAVVHRVTGRRGLQVEIAGAHFEGLAMEAVWRARKHALEGIAAAVHARAAAEAGRLATDVAWDAELGLGFTVWLLDAEVCSPPLPSAPPLAELSPTLAAALEDCDDAVDHLEVHVLPAGSPAEAIDAVEHLAPHLEGAPPRWVFTESGPRCVPTWRLPLPAEGLARTLAALCAHPAIAVARAVPAQPVWLLEDWPYVDPAWHAGERRCFLRARDGRRDRDALAQVQDRGPQAADDAVEVAVARAARAWLVPNGSRWGRPIADGFNRAGLELVPKRSEDVPAVLDALGAVDEDALLPFGTWAFPRTGPVVRLWYRRAWGPDDA